MAFRVATVIKDVPPAPTGMEHEADHLPTGCAMSRAAFALASCTRCAPWHSRHRTDAPLDDELVRLAAKVVHISALTDRFAQSAPRVLQGCVLYLDGKAVSQMDIHVKAFQPPPLLLLCSC